MTTGLGNTAYSGGFRFFGIFEMLSTFAFWDWPHVLGATWSDGAARRHARHVGWDPPSELMIKGASALLTTSP
jgi:hypothetical protein